MSIVLSLSFLCNCFEVEPAQDYLARYSVGNLQDGSQRVADPTDVTRCCLNLTRCNAILADKTLTIKAAATIKIR